MGAHILKYAFKFEWEKIIANEVTDKQLISRIYKQPYSSTPEK